jgi:UrcA family protein
MVMYSNQYAIRMAAVILACLPITMVAQAVNAAEPYDGVPHRVVSFRDLNLDTPDGAAALYWRIMRAAYEVCESPDRADLSLFKSHACIKDAVSRAIEQVNRPMLTSFYQSKTGKSDKKVATLARAN